MNSEKAIKYVGIFSMITLSGIIGFLLIPTVGYGQTPAPEQTVGGIYIALALAVIGLLTHILQFYLNQKAERVGLNPNSTDEKIIKAIMDLGQNVEHNAGGLAQLTNFIYNDVAPEKARQIVEGSLPLIKVKAVTDNVNTINTKLGTFEDLLNAIQPKVKSDPIPEVKVGTS